MNLAEKHEFALLIDSQIVNLEPLTNQEDAEMLMMVLMLSYISKSQRNKMEFSIMRESFANGHSVAIDTLFKGDSMDVMGKHVYPKIEERYADRFPDIEGDHEALYELMIQLRGVMSKDYNERNGHINLNIFMFEEMPTVEEQLKSMSPKKGP